MSALAVRVVRQELAERVPTAELTDEMVEKVIAFIAAHVESGEAVCGLAADAIAMNPRPRWLHALIADKAMSAKGVNDGAL